MKTHSHELIRGWMVILVVGLLFSACSGPPVKFVKTYHAKGIYHHVKSGENLYLIARAYNVNVQELAEANNIQDPGRIEADSVIFVPDAGQVIDDIIASMDKRHPSRSDVLPNAGQTLAKQPRGDDRVSVKPPIREATLQPRAVTLSLAPTIHIKPGKVRERLPDKPREVGKSAAPVNGKEPPARPAGHTSIPVQKPERVSEYASVPPAAVAGEFQGGRELPVGPPPKKFDAGPPVALPPSKADTGPPAAPPPSKADTGPPAAPPPSKADTGPPAAPIPPKADTEPPAALPPSKADTGPPAAPIPPKADTGLPAAPPPSKADAGPPVAPIPPKADAEPLQFDRKRFIWPVRGKVISRFGIQPNGMYYNGITIAAGADMKVVAAARGTVIFSGLLKDYGETIIIKHQDHYATVYTRLGQRRAKLDDRVKQAEMIGYLGKSEEKGGGPRLNFEIRYHNKARNPMFFLP